MCDVFFQKMGGCHKMHCYKCNNYFCWLCLTVLSGDKPYTHFSDESSPCYNKLFLGVEVDQDPAYLPEDYDNPDEYYDENAEPADQVDNYEEQDALQTFDYEQPEEMLLDLAYGGDYLYEHHVLGIDEAGDLERVEGVDDQEWEEYRLSVVNMQQQLLDAAAYHPI